METKIAECIKPDRPCRGCSYSHNPALYDGGCTLYRGVGGIKSLQPTEGTTDREHHAQNRKNQTESEEFLENGQTGRKRTA